MCVSQEFRKAVSRKAGRVGRAFGHITVLGAGARLAHPEPGGVSRRDPKRRARGPEKFARVTQRSEFKELLRRTIPEHRGITRHVVHLPETRHERCPLLGEIRMAIEVSVAPDRGGLPRVIDILQPVPNRVAVLPSIRKFVSRKIPSPPSSSLRGGR